MLLRVISSPAFVETETFASATAAPRVSFTNPKNAGPSSSEWSWSSSNPEPPAHNAVDRTQAIPNAVTARQPVRRPRIFIRDLPWLPAFHDAAGSLNCSARDQRIPAAPRNVGADYCGADMDTGSARSPSVPFRNAMQLGV